MKNRHLPATVLVCLLLPFAAAAQEGPEEALAAARQGDVREALGMIDAALAADPTDAEALFARGVILAEAGRRDEAEQTFRSVIELHPELPEGYNNLAVIQAGAGDFDGAVETLKSALATDPSYQTAYENLTRIFAQLASEAYSRALEVESPPAREQVELQMLAALAVPKAESPPPAGDRVAEARLAPAEPMQAVPEEPMAADPGEAVAAAVEEAGDSPVAAEPPAPSEPEPAAVESEDLAMDEIDPDPEPEADLGGLVDRWARAWSDQRVDDYLAFYAAGFLPDNGMSRDEWESNRRDRIGAPEFIKVEVAILDSDSEGADRAKVTFLQAYESDTYADQVTKTLTLVREDAEWKILEEKSGP